MMLFGYSFCRTFIPPPEPSFPSLPRNLTSDRMPSKKNGSMNRPTRSPVHIHDERRRREVRRGGSLRVE